MFTPPRLRLGHALVAAVGRAIRRHSEEAAACDFSLKFDVQRKMASSIA
jgi:hypothetical protein